MVPSDECKYCHVWTYMDTRLIATVILVWMAEQQLLSYIRLPMFYAVSMRKEPQWFFARLSLNGSET